MKLNVLQFKSSQIKQLFSTAIRDWAHFYLFGIDSGFQLISELTMCCENDSIYKISHKGNKLGV